MAGSEIYIGKMLEVFNAKMNTFSADMAESVEAMRAVESKLLTIATNTTQMIESVKVTNKNPDKQIKANASDVSLHYSFSSTSNEFKPSGIALSSFASGVIDIAFPQLTVSSGNGYTTAYPAVRVGGEIKSHNVQLPPNGGTIGAFNISVPVKPNETIEIGVLGKKSGSSSSAFATVLFPANGITVKWALSSEIINEPFTII